jgi:hypothetical protein
LKRDGAPGAGEKIKLRWDGLTFVPATSAEQEGYFRLTSPAMIPKTIRLPDGICEAIGRRLNLLSASCNDILATAAVIGHQFRLDVLTRASRPHSDDAVLEALDEALAAHIVEETDSGPYQFTHTLLRITLYDELRTGERRRRHNAVGDGVSPRSDPRPEPSCLSFSGRGPAKRHRPGNRLREMRRKERRRRVGLRGRDRPVPECPRHA